MRASRPAGPMLAASTLAACVLVSGMPVHAEGPEPSPPPDVGESAAQYPGNPAAEAELAHAEERRITDVATMMDSSRWAFPRDAGPLTLASGETSTVVLPAREEPYTLEELTQLVPDAIDHRRDGSYLISSHLVVDRGATLRIHEDDGLVVHLNSTEKSFASIVSIGGDLDFAGGQGGPVQISGWDSSRHTSDSLTDDGRAYIRAIRGSVTAVDVDLMSLGFWSGSTGGLALTGSDAPKVSTEQGEVISDPAADSTVDPDPAAPAPLVDPDRKREDGTVSATLTRVSARRDAIGLFATNIDELEVDGGEFSENLLGGVVLHRFVTRATLQDVSAHKNGADGIRASRGTTDVRIDRADVTGNGDDGIDIDGSPLADGPSATGIATGAFGGHRVQGSTVSNNAHDGIRVHGGSRISLVSNDVFRHPSGIVVGPATSDIEVSGNRIRSSAQHGISLRDGVTESRIRGNIIDGADTAIYARGSSGEIEDNTISGTDNHGITVIDQPARSTITGNTIAGSGPAAIDTSRSGTNVTLVANSAEDWEVAKPFPVLLRRVFQPLTVLWLGIAALLAATALPTARARRSGAPKAHPYADHTPLTELSAGVVPAASLVRARPEPPAVRTPLRAMHERRRWPYPHLVLRDGTPSTDPARGGPA